MNVRTKYPYKRSDWRGHYYALTGAMCLWGVSGGVINGTVQALYADCTPAGEVSGIFPTL